MIGLSGLYKRLDIILFTLLHEISHILNNDVSAHQEAIVDDEETPGILEKEEAADQLASSLMIRHQAFPLPPQHNHAVWVKEKAKAFGVHPAVIVGRLQKMEVLPWNTRLRKGIPSVIPYLERWE